MTKILATVVSLALIASGCYVMGGKYRADEPFTEAQIRKITPGTTTKQDLLDWFGPPVAVARKGAVMKIPVPGLRKEGSHDVQADTFFELFSSKHALTEQHIIYYYYYAEIKGTEVMVFLAGTAYQREVVDKLWLLVDDRTGVVADYIFRKAQ